MRIVLHEGVDLHSQAYLRRTLFSVQLGYFKLILQYILSAFRNVTLGRSSRSRFRYRRETGDGRRGQTGARKPLKLDFCKTEHQGLPGGPTVETEAEHTHPHTLTHHRNKATEGG